MNFISTNYRSLQLVLKSLRFWSLRTTGLQIRQVGGHSCEEYLSADLSDKELKEAREKCSEAMADQKADILKWSNDKGEFKRKPSTFRSWITKDGSSGFPAEASRYHLYVSLACPWAHRTLITRRLKGLEECISLNVVDYMMGEKGWKFSPDVKDATADTVNGCEYIREVYFLAEKDYQGRFTVPVLWDKKTNTVVNNESSEIIRMLNSEFNEFCTTEEQKALDIYPEPLRAKIDELNEWIYKDINNGVYRAGFVTSQEAYDKAVCEVFAALDKVEEILSRQRYLTGPTFNEADIRLYTTLARFDPVYVGHFKCNKKRIMDYPNIWGYLRDLYQTRGFGDTTNRYHIEHHYQRSHKQINPHGIVAIGPELDFESPHGRDTKFN